MGLFSSLLKSSKVSSTDKVWKTRNWAIKGMASEALLAITQNELPIIISFFPDTQKEVVQFFQSNQVPFFVLEAATSPHALDKTVFVTESSFVNSSAWADFMSAIKRTKPVFIFAGHYPLPTYENKIVSKLMNGQSGQPSILFCLSLEDPFMRAFNSDRLKPLLETLGLKDDECIEHAMVSKSILRAQEKLEKSIRQEIQTHSEEEWFKKNYKADE